MTSTHRRLLAAGLALGLLIGGVTACSSDSGSSNDDTSTDAGTDSGAAEDGDTDAGDSGGAAGEGLPDGFPGDIPLPDFKEAKVIKQETDDLPGAWVIMLIIDPNMDVPADDIVDAYSDQLRDVGWDVDDSGQSVEAENDDWSLGYHSAAGGTITISTLPR